MAASCWSSSAACCGLKLMFRQNQNEASRLSVVRLCRQCLIVVWVCGSFPLQYLIILNPFTRLHLQSDPMWLILVAVRVTLLWKVSHHSADCQSSNTKLLIGLQSTQCDLWLWWSYCSSVYFLLTRCWLVVTCPSLTSQWMNEWCLFICSRTENRTQ